MSSSFPILVRAGRGIRQKPFSYTPVKSGPAKMMSHIKTPVKWLPGDAPTDEEPNIQPKLRLNPWVTDEVSEKELEVLTSNIEETLARDGVLAPLLKIATLSATFTKIISAPDTSPQKNFKQVESDIVQGERTFTWDNENGTCSKYIPVRIRFRNEKIDIIPKDTTVSFGVLVFKPDGIELLPYSKEYVTFNGTLPHTLITLCREGDSIFIQERTEDLLLDLHTDNASQISIKKWGIFSLAESQRELFSLAKSPIRMIRILAVTFQPDS